MLASNIQTAGPLLLKNLHEAVDMAAECERTCKDFEEHRSPDTVNGWNEAELGAGPIEARSISGGREGSASYSSHPPFLTLVLVASNFGSAKRRIAESEVLDPESNNVLPHKLSPFSFVCMGLELKDQQYAPPYSL